MYGKEYVDWLENKADSGRIPIERLKSIKVMLDEQPAPEHFTKCPSAHGGHDLVFHTDGPFSGYKCQHCGLMIGEMIGGSA